MPITPTYPGVYIEGLPSAARTITGVSTSVTAFIGRALRGPTDTATLVHSFSDYLRIFGGLWKESNMSYVVYHYFLNGGMDAVIVRVHNGATDAVFERKDNLKLKAANPGSWGKNLSIIIDNNIDKEKLEKDDTLFNINVKVIKDGKIEAIETCLNLSTKSSSPRFITKILEEESDLIRVDGDVPSGQPQPSRFQHMANSGSDGKPVTTSQIVGDSLVKTGIYALEKAYIFNLLCIPNFDKDDDTVNRVAAYIDALEYCKKRRAMLIVDSPKEWNVESGAKDKAMAGVENFGLARHENAAIFFPRIRAAAQNEEGKLRDFDSCGVVAGVIARTDSQRGVWKAPAGIEATLIGVSDLTVHLTDKENGDLNASGINCLRILPAVGKVVWGARTMQGKDALANQWKYLPVPTNGSIHRRNAVSRHAMGRI